MRRLFSTAILATSIVTHAHASDLLISEVLYDTPGNDGLEEWIELFNPGCNSVSLSGYSLSDNSQTFTLSGSLGAGQYAVIARNSSGFQALYGSQPDLSGMTLALGNSGDQVQLKNGSTLVDSVAWEGYVSGWNLDAHYVSLSRSGINSQSPSDWSVSSTDSPGNGSLNSDCGGNGGVNESEYYAAASGLSGAALKAALQDIISSGHNKLSYSEVWTALQYTDEDPNNSNNVILIYTGRSADKDDRDGQPGSDNDSWNREHIWAKSLGFPSSSQYGYTDLHHLRPADKTVNSSRSNKDFDNGGSAQGEAPDTFTDSDSWEPRDEVKGDVARMIFYMDARYDGSDGNMPDLTIVSHTNTDTGDPEIGVLCTLYSWHLSDAVDAQEQTRNNRVYELQGNRNPFIDNPQWVSSIWGNACN